MNSIEPNIQPEPDAPVSKPVVKKRLNPLLPIGAVLLTIVLGAFVIGRGKNPETKVIVAESVTEDSGAEVEEKGDTTLIKFDGDASKSSGVQVTTVALSPAASGIPFNGEIEASPNRVVRVSSVVPGRVTRLLVSLGDNVRQGQTLAVVESRAIGEAQSAHQQATARFQNARSNLNVVLQQARAGVFSRAPLEAARRVVVDASADVREGENAVRTAGVGYSNAMRLARAGSYANPALEASRAQVSSASEAVKTAQAALDQAEASTESAQAELERRRQLAEGGAYVSRPVEEGRRVLVASQSARAAAQSEVATTRVNLARVRSLSGEGLVAKRDLENAQQAFETATAHLETSQADVEAAQSELERQQKLASTNVAGAAEVQAAQGALSRSQAEARSQRAQVQRAGDGLRLARTQLAREQNIFRQNIANRREVSGVQSTLIAARSALLKARQTLALANTAYAREQKIFKQNLNNTSQVQTARSGYVQAQSDLRAARSTLALFKSSPGHSASTPIVAPISGVVQERMVSQGEVLSDDTHLMTIADLSIVHIDAFIPEREIRHVRVGSPISATLDALPGRTFAGRIELIQTQVDEKTRTVEAHAEIPNPGDIKPGMFARGRIQTGTGNLQISVPANAVQDLDGKKVVFLPGAKAHTFVVREVEADAAESGRIVIKSGVKPGERIVTKGAFMVKAQSMKSELAEE